MSKTDRHVNILQQSLQHWPVDHKEEIAWKLKYPLAFPDTLAPHAVAEKLCTSKVDGAVVVCRVARSDPLLGKEGEQVAVAAFCAKSRRVSAVLRELLILHHCRVSAFGEMGIQG